MDLRFTAEELAFRDEVRSFIRSELPADIHQKMLRGQVLAKQDTVRWQAILDKKGWAVPHWAPEWGGTGWDTVRQYLFKEEMYAALAPEAFSVNVGLIGPVLIAFGTQQQKEFFLPKIARLDLWFCQGFSEPNSGSDLASLQTHAVRDGDHYIISGQKVWTSWAHHADWMFCLVRTDRDAKSQKGISYLLIDMKTPGITVRPIVTIDDCHHTNEVFLDEVRVPVANLIGEENRGWDYAKFLLGNERLTIARIGLAKARLRQAWELAGSVSGRDAVLADQPQFREKAAAIEAELLALEITNLRMLDEARRHPGSRQDPKASLLKLKGSDLQQATQELLLEIAGPHMLPRQTDYLLGADVPVVGPDWAATLAPRYLFGRAATIYGGTSEIQRNILARSVLGL